MFSAGDVCCFSAADGIWVGRICENIEDTDWLTNDTRKLAKTILKNEKGSTWRMSFEIGDDGEKGTERTATPDSGTVLFTIPVCAVFKIGM